MFLDSEAKLFGADADRVLVWDALSQFWLDTELDEKDIQRIAQTLADSPFTPEELRHIEFYEVRSVCAPNLLCVAGAWAGFAADWLIPRCLSQQHKHPFDSASEGLLSKIRLKLAPSQIPFERIYQIRLLREQLH